MNRRADGFDLVEDRLDLPVLRVGLGWIEVGDDTGHYRRTLKLSRVEVEVG